MFKSGVLTSNEMDSDLLFDRGWLIDRGRSIIRSLVIQLGVVLFAKVSYRSTPKISEKKKRGSQIAVD